jgi:hypothetical protein
MPVLRQARGQQFQSKITSNKLLVLMAQSFQLLFALMLCDLFPAFLLKISHLLPFFLLILLSKAV